MILHLFIILFGLLLQTASHASSPPLLLTLSESLQRAHSNNETLLIAQQDLATSHHQERESFADGLPQLTANLNYDRNWLLPNFVFGDQSVTIGAHNSFTGSIGIRQSLYSGGKLFAAVRIARFYRQYSQENIRLIWQQVNRNVETAFYDVLLAKNLLEVSKFSLLRAKKNYTLVQKLYEAGRVSEYDLLRAQTQVAEIRPDSIRADNHLKLVKLLFKNQMGVPSEIPIEITGTFRQTSQAKSHTNPLITGLQYRPEMRQQNTLISMRQQAERVSQSSSRPTLDLIINGQWQAQKDNFKFSTNDFRQSWFSGLALNIPLFDGFRTRSQVAQARNDTRRAELVHQKMERTIQLEIAQANQNLSESQARQIAQKQTIDLAQKGLKIAETRYNNGIGTQLEIVDAQLTLQRAEAALVQAKHDVAVAIVHLEYSLGILGEHITDQP